MKNVLILLIIIILTGCAGDLNIVINKDGTINENITLKEDASLFADTSYNEYYGETLEFYGEDSLSNYNIYKLEDGNDVGIKLNGTYDTEICAFFNKSALKKVIRELSCKQEGDTYTLYGEPLYFRCDENCFMPPDVSSGTINITLPTKAKKSNADEVNDKTYTWHFTGDEDEVFSLEFKFKKNTSNINESNNDYIKYIVVIFIIVAFLSLVIGSLLYKKYKNNKLDY